MSYDPGPVTELFYGLKSKTLQRSHRPNAGLKPTVRLVEMANSRLDKWQTLNELGMQINQLQILSWIINL